MGAEWENCADGLQCLECGAILPSGVERCSSCGNEKNLMAARWSPPGDGHAKAAIRGQFLGRETRILVGLTLALFCALAFLGTARARTETILRGEESGDLMLVGFGYSASGDATVQDDTNVTNAALGSELDGNINNLRLRAQVSDINGDFPAAVEAWKEVLGNPAAGLDDFLSLARAQEHNDDLLGAAETLTRASSRFPERPRVYLSFGALREREDNPEAARFQYQVGLSYCPDSEEIKSRLQEVDRVLTQNAEVTIPDWLNNTEIPEYNIPGPPREPAPVVIYETEPVEETAVGEIGPVNIFEGAEEVPDNGDNNQGEPDRSGVVTLIGSPGETTPDEIEDNSTVSGGDRAAETTEPIELRDIRVVASDRQVTIELITSRPAEFSTNRGTDAPRLFLRIPNAVIPAGATVPREISVHVPIVERISVVDGSDTNSYVSLVIYLDPAARHSVAAVGHSLLITIASAAEKEDEGME